MKVGFDAKRLFYNYTGLGNYSRTLLRNLYEFSLNNEYRLYSPNLKRNEETEFFLNNFKVDTASGITKSLWRSWGIVDNIKKDKLHIYHGLSHDMPFGIEKISNLGKVVTIHDVCYKTFPEMFPYIERKIYDVKYKHSCRVADKIIAISESTKRDIIELLGIDESKIDVVYQAMNPIYYNPKPLDICRTTLSMYNIPKDYILSVGSINSRKNLLSVLQAYIRLPKSMQLPLVVIGNGGEYMNECLTFAKNNGILNNIIILSNIKSSSVLQAFYQCATLMVYPSFYEGFGLPVTEAMLCGVPVITSSVSSLPEAGGDAAFYVSPSSIDDIHYGIEKVLNSESMRKSMINKGEKYANSMFSQKELTNQICEIYRTVCHGELI